MKKQKIGWVGLGKMGKPIARRLREAEFDLYVFDVDKEHAYELRKDGAYETDSIGELSEKSDIVCVMVPNSAVENVITQIYDNSSDNNGKIVIDFGNSNFKDSIRRAEYLKKKGIYFLDVGTSGGKQGANKGACLMIGGESEAYNRAEELLKVVGAPNGYKHIGGSGSGHFVKMVHNFIEYGIEECIGEGLEMIESGRKKFNVEIKLSEICELWNHGSIIESKLLGYMIEALENKELGDNLDKITGKIGGGETGEWASQTAMELKVPTPANNIALQRRYESGQNDSFACKCVAGMRNSFGGHEVYFKKE